MAASTAVTKASFTGAKKGPATSVAIIDEPCGR
jgi:hypothetical protein